MAGSVNFRLNSPGVQAMLDGEVADAACRARAERVLAAAKAGAPVDSGDYQADLHLEVDHTDRLRFKVVSTVPHRYVVEAATGNLARALGAAG